MASWLGKATSGLNALNESLKELTQEVMADVAAEEEGLNESEQLAAAKARLAQTEARAEEQSQAQRLRIRDLEAELRRLRGREAETLEVETLMEEALAPSHSHSQPSPPASPDAFHVQSLQDEVKGLREEVEHWKSLARAKSPTPPPPQPQPEPEPADRAELERMDEELNALRAALEEERGAKIALLSLRGAEKQLRRENEELATAYNDLNEELEKWKSEGERLHLESKEREDKLEAREVEVADLEAKLEKAEERAATAEEASERLREAELRLAAVEEERRRAEEVASEGARSEGPSDEGSGDSNGWDRLREEHAQTQASHADEAGGRGLSLNQLELQLREALAALTEKTEEVERLSKALAEKETQSMEKEELLSQVSAQLKGLENQVAQQKTAEEALRQEGKEQEAAAEAFSLRVKSLEEELELVKAQLVTLRDAGAATTQATEEEKAALEKELTQAKSRVAELESGKEEIAVEVGSLKLQMEEMAVVERELDSTKSLAEEAERRRDAAEASLAELRGELAAAVEQVRALEGVKESLEAKASALEASAGEAASSALAALQAQFEEARAESNRLREDLAGVTESREELVQALTEKQKEAISYYEEAERRGLALAQATEAESKGAKELERLRQHLLQMEEGYTQEALAAEERETKLRERLRTAQDADSQTQEAQRHHSQRLSALEAESSTIAAERDAAIAAAAEASEEADKSAKALAALQAVLHQLQLDQDGLMATELKRFQTQLSRIGEEKEALEEAVRGKEAQIAALEADSTSTADLRAELGRKEEALSQMDAALLARDEQIAALRTQSKEEEERMDKALARNIFLSYATAPADKRAEVAPLVASVLGLSKEETARVRAGGSESGWLSFLRSQGGPPSKADSITAQFVRFLEEGSAEKPPPPPAKPLSQPPPLSQPSPSAQLRLPTFEKDSALLAAAPDTSDFLKSALLPPKPNNNQ